MPSIVSSLLLRPTLAAALLATLPALAAAPAPAAPAHVKPSPVMVAIQALAADLRGMIDSRLPLQQQLEQVAAARPSPQTADKLRAAFGTDRLYALERRPPVAGKPVWRTTLFPLQYTSAEGVTSDWSEGLFDLTLNGDGSAATGHGGIERILVEDKDTRMAWRGIVFDTDQRRGYAGLWFGTMDARVGQLRFQNKHDGTVMDMNGMRFASRVTEKPKTVDIAYENRIGSIAVAGEQVDDIRFALRVTNLGKQAMADLKTAGDKLKARKAAPQAAPAALTPQQIDALKPLLRSFGEAALASGTAIEIDEVSASYHGSKVMLKGRVALQGATREDLDDPKRLANKVVARLDVRVPLALVREIAATVAARQAAAQAAQRGAASDPKAVAEMGKNMGDIMIGKLAGDGLARIEDDALVSTLEWKDGKLTANGKPVPLPKPASNAAPRLAGGPGSGNFLQARLVDGSCTLPGFPDEVTRADRPLRQRIEFNIGADGRVKDTRVTQPSGFPEYDRAMLAALAQCVYIPALRDGKPIELHSARETVRSAGAGADSGAGQR